MSLAQQQGIPFVPVHHMEAHALTVRQGMVQLTCQSIHCGVCLRTASLYFCTSLL